MLENYNIKVTKWEWVSQLPNDQNNFFASPTLPGAEKVAEITNFKDYLIDIGNITYNLDTSDDDEGANNLYYEDSELSLTVSGILNSAYLYSFFEINNNSKLIQSGRYYKWIIKITKLDNSVVYAGIITPENISESFSPDTDSEKIEIKALGLLKEFKDYYSNIPLPTYPSLSDMSFLTLLRNNLIQVPRASYEIPLYIDMESDISGYQIFKDAYFNLVDQSTTMPFVLSKCGYTLIQGTNETCWGFLNKVCKAMGWVMYFDKYTLWIRNRSSVPATTETITFDNFIEYKALRTKDSDTYEAIIIPDGQFYGGKGAGFGGTPNGFRRGSRFYMLTTKHFTYKNNIPFGLITYSANSRHIFFDYVKWEKLHEVDDNIYRYVTVANTTGDNYSATYREIAKNKILFVDGGTTGDYGLVMDTGSNYQGYRDISTTGGNDVFVTGNYGNTLFKWVSVGGVNKRQTYYDYAKTPTFRNNFLKYAATALSSQIEVTYKSVDLPLNSNYLISNNNDLTGTWSVNGMTINLKDEVTELKLQLKTNAA